MKFFIKYQFLEIFIFNENQEFAKIPKIMNFMIFIKKTNFIFIKKSRFDIFLEKIHF